MSGAAEILLPREFESCRAVSSPGWLQDRRARALRSVRAGAIPHRRIEEWKYTDLRNELSAPRDARREGDVARTVDDPFAAIAGARLVVANGRVQSGAHPAGIDFFDLEALDDHAPDWVKRNLGEVHFGGVMGQASLALMQGGLAIRVQSETDTPVHLRILQDSASVHCRALIVVEQGSSLILLESHTANAGFANIGLEVVLEPDARLTHIRLANSSPDGITVEEIGVRMASNSSFNGHFAQRGAKLSRVELAIALEGEGAKVELSGATMLDGNLHADVTTRVDHVAGKTASRQLFKHVAAGQARAIYQGKITVRKGADGSDSRQTARAILLSDRAEVDLKPELEILADDVKCAHGAAVGDLDPDTLFYLRSRGLPEYEARELLIRAFLDEAVAEISPDFVRSAVEQFVETNPGFSGAGRP